MADRLVSQAEYARLRGFDRAYVSKLKRGGRLVLRDGKVDVAATDAHLAATRDPSRGGKRRGADRIAEAPAARNETNTSEAEQDADATLAATTAAQGMAVPSSPAEAAGDEAAGEVVAISYEEARRREMIARAKSAELEAEQKARSLVWRADVEREYFARAKRLSGALLSIPDRVASILAAEADAAKIHSLLTQELSNVLNAQAIEVSP